MSIHQLHLSPHSSRTQSLGEQSCFSLFGGNFFLSNLLESIFLYLANIPRMWFGGWPIFPWPPMNSLDLFQLNHNHYVFICHLYIETKFNLVPLTIGVFGNFWLKYFPSWHLTTSLQAQGLAPHIYHVSIKECVFQNEVHIINFT
jgi:hypothetical protein